MCESSFSSLFDVVLRHAKMKLRYYIIQYYASSKVPKPLCHKGFGMYFFLTDLIFINFLADLCNALQSSLFAVFLLRMHRKRSIFVDARAEGTRP